jgi:hypothetical protein
MKKFLLVVSVILFSFGFTIQSKTDTRLVGTWKGSEKNNQVEGVQKSWIMTRKGNGTYKIEFSMKDENGKNQTTSEKGKWWTSGNQFFEQYEGSETPTIYTYKVLDTKTIYFKLKSSEDSFQNENYEFIDTKID